MILTIMTLIYLSVTVLGIISIEINYINKIYQYNLEMFNSKVQFK